MRDDVATTIPARAERLLASLHFVCAPVQLCISRANSKVATKIPLAMGFCNGTEPAEDSASGKRPGARSPPSGRSRPAVFLHGTLISLGENKNNTYILLRDFDCNELL